MSVTGYMYNINATKNLGELELREGLEGNRSWHNQFRNSAYIYIGGLNQGLTEGDVVIVFSQFGEIVDVNMVRDKATGKSKGFAFICYEDQRSTVLAVDNMNGCQLANRTLRVDHVDKYKAPKNFDEDQLDEDGDPTLKEYTATGAEGHGQQVHNVTEAQRKISEVERQKQRKVAEPAAPDDEDEAWAKSFEESLKQMDPGGSAGKKKSKGGKIKEAKKEIKLLMKEAKKLKKETQKAKKAAKKRKKEKVEKKGKRGHREERSTREEDDADASTDSSEDESSMDSDSSEKQPRKRKK